jgi:hypothetical protein
VSVRYRVEFRYRDDTGEVEMLRVEVVEGGQRASDHDEQHDRVAGEVAGVIEQGAEVTEVTGGPAAAPLVHRATREPEQPVQQGREQLDG